MSLKLVCFLLKNNLLASRYNLHILFSIYKLNGGTQQRACYQDEKIKTGFPYKWQPIPKPSCFNKQSSYHTANHDKSSLIKFFYVLTEAP